MTIAISEHVRLRELTGGDLEVVATMMADEEQMNLYPRPRTREETKSWIKRNLELCG